MVQRIVATQAARKVGILPPALPFDSTEKGYKIVIDGRDGPFH